MPSLNDAEKQRIKAIIIGTDENATLTLITEAERIGGKLAGMKFATSQIRNIFGVVRSIEQRVDRDSFNDVDNKEGEHRRLTDAAYRELLLIKPKLAYQYGRATNTPKEPKKDAMELLKDALTLAIDQVERDYERFNRFVEFFEAILAYHRSAGGKS